MAASGKEDFGAEVIQYYTIHSLSGSTAHLQQFGIDVLGAMHCNFESLLFNRFSL